MCLFAFVFLEHMQPRLFFQFESVGFLGSAGANQTLPLRGSRNILDVRAVTVGQAKIFHQILHATIWAFDIETGLQHFYLDAEMARSSGGPLLVKQEFPRTAIAPKLGYRRNVTLN
jgi:hypothetical protein